MEQQIIEYLNAIEANYQVRILYACEGGSRAWGTNSEDSDFDVRFIYLPTPKWYLSIDQKRDVIEVAEHPQIEFHGWELTKTLRLFRKSNPPLLEWLDSPIKYIENVLFTKRLKELKTKAFNEKAFLNHYLSMAKRNYKQHCDKEDVKVKAYFNILRPILACAWYMKYKEQPPVHIDGLLMQFNERSIIKLDIQTLISKKFEDRNGKVPQQPRLNEFVEKEMERIEWFIKESNPRMKQVTEDLDELFQMMLMEIWNIKM